MSCEDVDVSRKHPATWNLFTDLRSGLGFALGCWLACDSTRTILDGLLLPSTCVSLSKHLITAPAQRNAAQHPLSVVIRNDALYTTMSSVPATLPLRSMNEGLNEQLSDLLPATRLRTLFGETIRSTALPSEEPQKDPNTLTFHSSAFTSKTTSSTTSNQSSYSPDGWLTSHLQNLAGPHGPTYYTHGEPAMPTPRRRGNPKVLFMGMRRCVNLMNTHRQSHD